MKPASWPWVALVGVAILGVGLGLTALILALDDDTASPSLLAALPAPDRAAPAPSHTEAVPIPGAGARGVQEAAQPTRGGLLLGLAVRDTDAGLTVHAVLPGSGAAEVGLQPNDVIRSLNGVPVQSPEAVRDALADLSPGDTVSLRIERDGAERTLDVALGPGGFPFGHGDPGFPSCHEGGFAPFPFPRFPGLPNGSFEFDGRFEGAEGTLHVEAAGDTLLSLSDDAVTVAVNDAERTFTLDGETTVRGEPTPGDHVLVVALNGEARLIAAAPHLLPSPPPAPAAQA